MKRIFATPQDAEAAFYDALERSDLDAMMEVWAEDDEIVCVHPGGPRVAGYEQVRESWQRIFSSGQKIAVRISHAVRVLSGMLAVHSVHENLHARDDRTQAVAIATNVYARAGDGWRLLVHHASPAEAAQAVATVVNEPPQILH